MKGKDAARSAENSTTFRTLARAGYVASGIVHGLIGVLAFAIALTGRGESDQSTALQAIASAPFGEVVLWLLAVMLAGLGAFHAVSGFTQAERDEKKKWGRRLSHWGQAVAFLAMGVIAAYTAIGNRTDGDSSVESTSRGLLDAPGGPVLLTIIGIGIAAGGVAFAVVGLRRGFAKKMRIPSGGGGATVTVLGVVGYLAKGASIAVMGVLITLAGVQDDPESAGAVNSAIQTLHDLPGGPIIVGFIGAGLLAYGVFCCFRSRYADL